MTNQATITTIRAGHKIVTSNATYEVLGNMKARSGYKYICRAPNGGKVTLDREDILEAQRDGSATITA